MEILGNHKDYRIDCTVMRIRRHHTASEYYCAINIYGTPITQCQPNIGTKSMHKGLQSSRAVSTRGCSSLDINKQKDHRVTD